MSGCGLDRDSGRDQIKLLSNVSTVIRKDRTSTT